jgi:hypothetical protein
MPSDRPGRSAPERKKLQKREEELFQAHGRQWLGDLAPFFLDQEGVNEYLLRAQRGNRFQFVRGWLDSVHVPVIDVALARRLARAPQTRLLRKLAMDETAYEEPGEYEEGDDVPEGTEFPTLYPLLRASFLHNLRVFQLGEMPDESVEGYYNCHIEGEVAVDLIKKMPRLEELYLLAHGVDMDALFKLKTVDRLRVLLVYHMNHYPLEVLARNPAFGNLTHLLLHPHAYDLTVDPPYITAAGVDAVLGSRHLGKLTHLRLRMLDMGDAVCEAVVRSGILKRLQVLDLRHGRITDQGARVLAACPDLRHLERLDVARNSLTNDGVAILKQTGVAVEAGAQHTERDEEDAYMYEGDIE